jgi:hypothetical protein
MLKGTSRSVCRFQPSAVQAAIADLGERDALPAEARALPADAVGVQREHVVEAGEEQQTFLRARRAVCVTGRSGRCRQLSGASVSMRYA